MSDEEQYDRAFISYIDEKGNIVDGYFNNIIIKDNYVSFDTAKNRLVLPWVRVLKVKSDVKRD